MKNISAYSWMGSCAARFVWISKGSLVGKMRRLNKKNQGKFSVPVHLPKTLSIGAFTTSTSIGDFYSIYCLSPRSLCFASSSTSSSLQTANRI